MTNSSNSNADRTLGRHVTTSIALTVVLLLGVAPALFGKGGSEVVGSEVVGEAGSVKEDDPRWDCRTMGNRVCGPASEAAPGCYADGVLVLAWVNYAQPELDALYGQPSSPC